MRSFRLVCYALLFFSVSSHSAPAPSTDLLCGSTATSVSVIQGTGNASPLVGQEVVIEAVITADFTQSGGLDGFFVQTVPSEQDDDPATSEGLFVYDPQATVSAGQRVRVAGTVVEFHGLTELANVTGIESCGAGATIEPTMIALPWDTLGAAEAYEGMRVRFASALIVTDTFNLARFGSLTLSSERHFIPTHVVAPGAKAHMVADRNARDRLLLDDGSKQQNPDTVPYPTPELTATQTLRLGDQVTDLVGILDYRYGEWRLQPEQTPSFIASNPRPPAPELEDRGNLVVASFNLFNFFNGDGEGGGFPTARGASNGAELQRQTDKLVSAIQALDADVVGLMEIENDGYGDESAIAELVTGLGRNWSYVDPQLDRLGGDAIAVGLIYRNDRVVTTGKAATLTGPAFANLNRQPLAQTFRLADSEDGVTVAVNHLKSKGCDKAQGTNIAQGDGQGCWNQARTLAAHSLADWLADDATGSGEKDVLIIGDLNSYAREDPVAALTSRGYTDLIKHHMGEKAYSFVFFGKAGYLDYGLANTDLASKVVGATVWHINADEPRALDYNLEFPMARQQFSFYKPGPYRASDHDPVIVALRMNRFCLPINTDGRRRLGD